MIGEVNSQNCIRKGAAITRSRLKVPRDAKNIPMAKAKTRVSRISTGSQIRAELTGIRYQIIRPARTTPAMAKSKREVKTADKGNTSFGAAIFLTTLALSKTLGALCITALAKKVHGTRAAKVKMG